jgi:hypothetical protein
VGILLLVCLGNLGIISVPVIGKAAEALTSGCMVIFAIFWAIDAARRA